MRSVSLNRSSLHSSFAWVLIGNVIYALSQWGMVIALARLSTPSALGRFTLGIAISTPVILFANLQCVRSWPVTLREPTSSENTSG
jgi:O-antigen/teichoic acid export membrane protein